MVEKRSDKWYQSQKVMASSRGRVIVREGLLGPECHYEFGYTMSLPAATALKIALRVRCRIA
ncbi:hypothetical protein RHMOL_Rhmol10G0207400 [Rhododendron molle]|uniref:Uncharacterized protein n=1 Tax=Rhododendron molle TaxID=49168 RepID=A0ACC0M5M3_RHOML|nr:hypothetical protein RHMOL_Rhmol10G0207400 [Rhododendron molle]